MVGFLFGMILVGAVGAYDSGAFDKGGFDFEEVRNGSNGNICKLVDKKVLGYDGSRCDEYVREAGN